MFHRLPTGLNAGDGTFALRYQFAKDGDAESQVTIANILLKKGTSNNDHCFENANLGIHWLLRAASKGHPKAYHLLRQCYKSGLGITPTNKPSVEACLAHSESDIIACKVAHKIFRTTMCDSEEGVTEEAFSEKVESLFTENEKDGDLNDEEDSIFDYGPTTSDNESKESTTEDIKRISVSDIMYSVKQCLEGNLPLVALKNAVQSEEYNKWLKYVHSLSNFIYHSLEMIINDLGSPVLPLMLILFLVLCWMGENVENIYFITNQYKIFFSNIFCLAVMLSCTCYIIILHFGYYNINKWLDLIKLFEPMVKSDEVKKKYMDKMIVPLLIFFSISFVYNILKPAHSMKFLSGELLVLSVLLLVLVDRTITNRRYFVNISLILNSIVCLHKINAAMPFHLPDFLNLDIHFLIYDHFEFHLNWLSCITLPFVLPYLYFAMAKGYQNKDWLQTLLPHLMCLTWLNLACDFAETAAVLDVIIGICFWVVVFIFSKILGSLLSIIVCSSWKILYLTEAFTYDIAFRSLLLPVIIIFYLSRYLTEKCKQMFNKYVALFMFTCLAIMLLRTTSPIDSSVTSSDSVLSWNQYETYCHRNAWYQTNMADIEIECRPLKDKLITVEGTVMQIESVKITNIFQQMADALPFFNSYWFAYLFGEKICNKDNMNNFEKERCNLFQKLKVNDYHLHNWDTYQFRITLEVTSRISPEVIIIADNFCTSFVRKLKDGDGLRVTGVLYDGLGSTSPEIILKEATCSSCYEHHRTCKIQSSSSSFNYELSWHHLTEFYLSPFVQYLH